MTLPRILLAALAALAIASWTQIAGAESGQSRVVVVADAAAPAQAVRAAVEGAGPDAELRVPRTATEQLSVTHLFAAKGYDIVGVGLARDVAVDPVAREYPAARFTLTD